MAEGKVSDVVEYVDRPELPELYANHIRNLNWEAGVLRIEFCVDRLEESAPGTRLTRRYPAARIALPGAIAVDLQKKLAYFAEQLQRGLSSGMKQMTQ